MDEIPKSLMEEEREKEHQKNNSVFTGRMNMGCRDTCAVNGQPPHLIGWRAFDPSHLFASCWNDIRFERDAERSVSTRHGILNAGFIVPKCGSAPLIH
ncbi:hypothetical protein OUZ56_015814 [Daphnia magna]|uniref:Uncharacterized protein n=1 Tax=Daphnia magna TaxID=35525 RepID=A0ABR0APA6_9CRUS|nr:hypothetical protein OUZ56_015814 [Daphnia magna]